MTKLASKLFSTLAAGAVLGLAGAIATTPALANDKTKLILIGDKKLDPKFVDKTDKKFLKLDPKFDNKFDPKLDPKFDKKFDPKK